MTMPLSLRRIVRDLMLAWTLWFGLFWLPEVAMGQDALAVAQLFIDHSPKEDGSGRSGKLAHALAIHEQRKPSEWETDKAAIKDLPVLMKLQITQEIVNRRIPYQDDQENIWKAPVDAYHLGGDCEDYAIAKLLLLRESHVPEKNLRLATLAPMTNKEVYHVILLAQWQDKIYVLDSPNRTPSGKMVPLEAYKDANRPVIWAGWSGGFTQKKVIPLSWSYPVADSYQVPSHVPLYAPMRLISYRQYPIREKLVRIAADLLIIHPWETPLTPEEVKRLRLLRTYFHDPTQGNAQLISDFERVKLDELRRMRKGL